MSNDAVRATDDPPIADPIVVGGIRNFAWVEPGLVARGEQPPLVAETFEALKQHGIRTVLSLRPDREPPPRLNRRGWAEYAVEEEQRAVEQSGMLFRHAPLTDFSAPPPDEIAAAIAELDAAVDTGAPVFVHCRAGVGRATLVSGAWTVSHGRPGDYALAIYERFMRLVGSTLNFSDEERLAMLHRVGQPQVLWALGEIVRALGSPASHEATWLLPPEMPEGAEEWSDAYWTALRPWRDRRLRAVG
jgi:uncharacterized protein (TIGR01244 family)